MKIVRVFVAATCVLAAFACSKKSSNSSDNSSQSVITMGTHVSFSNITGTAATATWGAATDSTTDSANLMYKVVYSPSNNITTAVDAEANGTMAMDWTAATLTTGIAGLSSSTAYYVAVIVKDPSGNENIDVATLTTLCGGKIIYLTAVGNGNFGGAMGGDTICNNHKPTGYGGSNFKAMVGDKGGGTPVRAPCYVTGNDNCSGSTAGRADWVFTANETICSEDLSKVVGTTNGQGYLTVNTANSVASSNLKTFTGFNIAWGVSVTNNCTDFSSTGGAAAVTGMPNSTGQNFYAGDFNNCSSAGYIYCVEQ
jgi:hypothetical protein